MEVWAHPFGGSSHPANQVMSRGELPDRKRSCPTEPGSSLSAGGLVLLPADPDPKLSLAFKSQDMGMWTVFLLPPLSTLTGALRLE